MGPGKEAMSEAPLDRKMGESDAQYALRLYQDPWFEDSTPAEVADFAGLSHGLVSRVLFAWAKSMKVRRIHSHAASVAEQIGWSGTSEGLVHTALELLVQRAQKREAVPPSDIDSEIEHFVAEHRVASD
jgi:hypothetical protein